MSKHTQPTQQPRTTTSGGTGSGTGDSRSTLMSSLERLEAIIRNDHTIQQNVRNSLKTFATLLKNNQQVNETTIAEQHKNLATLRSASSSHPAMTGALQPYATALETFSSTQGRPTSGMGNTYSATKGPHGSDIKHVAGKTGHAAQGHKGAMNTVGGREQNQRSGTRGK